MAHLHTRRTAYKTGGASASQRVSYITRQPVRELGDAERQLQYAHDPRREDLVYANHRNLPAWAHDDPHAFFRAAEQYERGAGSEKCAGVAFEEWKMSLPVELSHRQNMDVMRDVVDSIAGTALPCAYAFHDPRTMDAAQQQPHLHLLLSARKTDGIDRTPMDHFKRYNRAHPERGGAQKDPMLSHMGAVKAQRVLISDILNLHLERHGLAARVHPDSLEERRLSREPEPKLLPSESKAYRERGIISETMQQVLAIRAQRAREGEIEHLNAQAYWGNRSRILGLTPAMSHEQRVERVRQARERLVQERPPKDRTRARTRDRTRARPLEAKTTDLQREIAGLERFVVRLGAERRAEERATRQGRERPVTEQWQAERVLAEGKRHGLPRDLEAERAVRVAAAFARKEAGARIQDLVHDLAHDDTPTAGGAMRVRVFDREHERDGGISW